MTKHCLNCNRTLIGKHHKYCSIKCEKEYEGKIMEEKRMKKWLIGNPIFILDMSKSRWFWEIKKT
jgi:hypothetical protein